MTLYSPYMCVCLCIVPRDAVASHTGCILPPYAQCSSSTTLNRIKWLPVKSSEDRLCFNLSLLLVNVSARCRFDFVLRFCIAKHHEDHETSRYSNYFFFLELEQTFSVCHLQDFRGIIWIHAHLLYFIQIFIIFF